MNFFLVGVHVFMCVYMCVGVRVFALFCALKLRHTVDYLSRFEYVFMHAVKSTSTGYI